MIVAQFFFFQPEKNYQCVFWDNESEYQEYPTGIMQDAEQSS